MHVVPRTRRVDFRWFLNHQNGWCDLRLGSDAAIRSWLCLGHPVVSPPVGPPLVIGVGWKWNKGKTSPWNHVQWGFSRKHGDFPWLYVGLPEVNWKKSVFTEFHLWFFAWKPFEKCNDFPMATCMIILGVLLHQPYYSPPNCFTNWFRKTLVRKHEWNQLQIMALLGGIEVLLQTHQRWPAKILVNLVPDCKIR